MRKTGNFAQKVWLWLIASFCWLAFGKVKQDLSPDILDKVLKTFNPPANNSLPALQKAAQESLVHVRAVMTSESWSFPQQADDGLGKYK